MGFNQIIPLSCDRPNFTGCDQCALNVMRPHLIPLASQFIHNGNTPCLPLPIEQTGQRLSVRVIFDPDGKHYLLLLEEAKPPSFSIPALELIGLTKREAEVLFWIAKDKTNAGIAKVLGCCESTVRKHLENLYEKLGVQTRTGAVMVALESLGLLKA